MWLLEYIIVQQPFSFDMDSPKNPYQMPLAWLEAYHPPGVTSLWKTNIRRLHENSFPSAARAIELKEAPVPRSIYILSTSFLSETHKTTTTGILKSKLTPNRIPPCRSLT